MSPIVTSEFMELGLIGGGGGGFNPTTLGTCILSLKGNAKAYTDALQASPCVNFGDLCQQWRDEREIAGGSAFPYASQPTGGSRPQYAPQLSATGGMLAQLQAMTLTGLPSIDKQNCTLAFVGLPWADLSLNTAPVILALEDIPNQFALGLNGIGADLNVQADINYDGADHSPTTPTYQLAPLVVVVIQSTPTAVTMYVNGTLVQTTTAAVSHTGTTGYLFDWSAHNATLPLSWCARSLVYSPALSSGDLTTLNSGLVAEAHLNSPWPLSYPLVAFTGDSLTLGVGHGTVSSSQTYPAQTLSLLSNPRGYCLAAQTGKTIDQIATAWGAGIDALYLATGRTGPQVCSYWAGTNDCELGTAGSAIFADYKSKLGARKTRGWKVLCFSIMNNAGFSSGNVTEQGNFNTAIRADFTVATSNAHVFKANTGTTYADYLIDVQSEPNLQTTSNTTYFSDGTHLTSVGYGIVAGDVKTALNLLGVT